MTQSNIVDRKRQVFVSYRQLDGDNTATMLAWLLRAAGIPVWQDTTDLAPGNTEDRLRQALSDGLAGAVLVITPDLARSGIVRKVELKPLLTLAQDPAFVLAIANEVRAAGDRTDYDAPDRLLGQPKGTLSTIKQYPVQGRADLIPLVEALLGFRAHRIAIEHRGVTPPPLHLSVQTRDVATDYSADFNIRLRPPKSDRLPDPQGLADLRDVLPLIPQSVTRTGASTVRITGGGHLSVCFALGLALPGTLIGHVLVEGSAGDVWTCHPVHRLPGNDAQIKVGSRTHASVKPTGEQRQVLAYVDLLQGSADTAYARLLEERSDEFDAWEVIRPTVQGRLNAETAGQLIEETAGALRTLVAENDGADLHLLLACPYPVALLLGRLSNTLNVTLYERDDPAPGDTDKRHRYVPVLTVNASKYITDVWLTTDDTKDSE